MYRALVSYLFGWMNIRVYSPVRIKVNPLPVRHRDGRYVRRHLHLRQRITTGTALGYRESKNLEF